MKESLADNTTISHYRILSKIGTGGMGEVYLAEDTRLHRKVALKILPADLASNLDRMRRFDQEAQGHLSSIDAIPQIKSAAAKALALDHSLSESHLSLAMLKLWYERDWVEAEKELRQAIAMNPNNSEAHQTYAYFLAFMERHSEAIAEANRTLILDPISVFINFYIGWVFWLVGRNDLTIELGRKVVEMDAQFCGGYHLAGVARWTQGDLEQALADVEAAAARGAGPIVTSLLACLYGITGDREKAQQILDELITLSAQGRARRYDVALGYAALGEIDQAFEWLEQGYEQREGTLLFLKQSAALLIPGL